MTFSYDTMTSPLLEDLTLHLTRGWTGVVGPNGSGKTTLLRLALGELVPTRGRVEVPDGVLLCPQRTDQPPPGFAGLMASFDGPALATRARLRVDDDWLERWATLSHGERKRAQVATMLWRSPAVAAVDEPTNHLDGPTRDLLAEALASFEGVGLLVSHDRQLLDDLCDQCLFLDPPRAVLRPGGYTAGAASVEADRDRARSLLDEASNETKRLRREENRRRAEASRADRLRSKRGIARHDSDAREKVNRARNSGRDAVAGRLLRQMEGRARQAEERRSSLAVVRDRPLGICFQGEPCRREVLLRVDEGTLGLGPVARLAFPSLAMGRDDRVALVGPNGAGKTTLLEHVLGSLTLPAERVVAMPQEVDEGSSRALVARVRSLPRADLGRVMTVVSRLGSDPGRLLETDLPSPGEVRKLLLAQGIARSPWLIALDEPTNHLDLTSVLCLEDALDECPCALLMVSHDRRFLDRLARRRWRFVPDEEGYRVDTAGD